jgi:hypothetical protein
MYVDREFGRDSQSTRRHPSMGAASSFHAYGKFMQADPLGYGGDGPNLYAYGLNDPVNHTDPLGLRVPATGSLVGNAPPIGPFSCSGDCSVYQSRPGSGPNDPNLGGYWERTPVKYTWDPATQSWAPIITANLWVSYGFPSFNFFDRSTWNLYRPEDAEGENCTPSPSQLANSGKVEFAYGEGSVAAAGTAGDSVGTFETEVGYSGTFHTEFEGIFVGLKGIGVAAGIGISKNLGTFQGRNINYGAAIPGFSSSLSFDDNANRVGVSGGLATPSIGIYMTKSYTYILTLKCPK